MLTKLLNSTVEEVPPLPAKTAALHGQNDTGFIERRVAGLDDFLKTLVHTVLDSSKCEPLMEFLGLVPGWGSLQSSIMRFFEPNIADINPPELELDQWERASKASKGATAKKQKQTAGEIGGVISLEAFQVLEAFTCDEAGSAMELPMEVFKGQVVQLIQKQETGWWYVTNGANRHGWVPATLLSPLDRSKRQSFLFASGGEDDNEEAVEATAGLVDNQGSAAGEEDATTNGDSREPPTIDAVVGDVDGGGCDGGANSSGEQEGLKATVSMKARRASRRVSRIFGGSGIAEADTAASTGGNKKEKYIVVKNHIPTESDEVELVKGSVVFVNEKRMDGWWLVALTTGEVGRAPAVHLKRLAMQAYTSTGRIQTLAPLLRRTSMSSERQQRGNPGRAKSVILHSEGGNGSDGVGTGDGVARRFSAPPTSAVHRRSQPPTPMLTTAQSKGVDDDSADSDDGVALLSASD